MVYMSNYIKNWQKNIEHLKFHFRSFDMPESIFIMVRVISLILAFHFSEKFSNFTMFN
jgi:hypothetical protein